MASTALVAPAALAALVAACVAGSARASAKPWPGPLPSPSAPAVRDDGPTATGLALTGLIAVHEVRIREGAPAHERSRVELDGHGRRITQLGAGAVQRIVVNVDEDRVWLVDRARRIVHEIPFVRPADVEATPALPGPLLQSSDEGAVLDASPCAGLHATAVTPVTWRGRAATSATCVGPLGERRSVQTFDARAGLVVRLVANDGTIDELRDIEPMRFAPEHFVPAASLRPVGIRELLGHVAPVASYREP